MSGVYNVEDQFLIEESGLKNLVLICSVFQSELCLRVEYMLRETYNRFPVSPKCTEASEAIYETITCSQKPLQITKADGAKC